MARALPIVLLLTLGVAVLAAPAVAHDYKVKGLKIGHPWTRPAAQGTVGVGYLTITNRSGRADVLKAVETGAATTASLHRSTMKGGIMSMRPRAEGFMIVPGQTIRLAPGGDHIMLTGLAKPLVKGAVVPATLVFERAGRVPVEFTVETDPPAAAPAVISPRARGLH